MYQSLDSHTFLKVNSDSHYYRAILESIPQSDSNILIIDDDKAILKILAKILRQKGYTVDTAETGRDALNKIGTQQYDVALIDVRLQDISGLDLLNQIQKIAPIMIKIVLTSYVSDEDRTTALERGADYYLAKPIKSEKLIEIIKNKLEQHQSKPQTDRCETTSHPHTKRKV